MFAQKMMDEAFADINMQENTAGRQWYRMPEHPNSKSITVWTACSGTGSQKECKAGYAAQMLGINREIAATELRRDTMVMGAEERKNIADQQDHDAFYSNISQNLADMTTAGMMAGKNMNINETNQLSAIF